MSKVVALPRRGAEANVEPVDAMSVFYGLRSLWVAGCLPTDAYILGCQVVSKMVTQGTRDCSMLPSHSFVTAVQVNGRVYLGPMRTDADESLTFVAACQALHFRGGVLSHYDPECLNEPDAFERHFSLSPDRPRWSLNTSIFYRLPAMTQAQYDAELTSIFREGMQNVSITHALSIGDVR